MSIDSLEFTELKYQLVISIVVVTLEMVENSLNKPAAKSNDDKDATQIAYFTPRRYIVHPGSTEGIGLSRPGTV